MKNSNNWVSKCKNPLNMLRRRCLLVSHE